MAYLNDSFTGGNTNFLDENVQTHPIIYPLKPETGKTTQNEFSDNFNRFVFLSGMILIFEHEMFHEGEQIHQGLKYIMRRLKLDLNVFNFDKRTFSFSFEVMWFIDVFSLNRCLT